MDGIVARFTARRPAVVWVVWLLCLGVWTVALLTTFPVQVKDAVLSPEAGYPASKILHITAYAFLATLAGWLLPENNARFLPVVFLSFHAFGTEFLQQFVDSRTGCLTDVGFNHLGIALGLLLTWWKWRVQRD